MLPPPAPPCWAAVPLVLQGGSVGGTDRSGQHSACSCCSEPEKLCFVTTCMELMLGELLDTFNPICATSVWFGFAFLAGKEFDVLCETNSSESKVGTALLSPRPGVLPNWCCCSSWSCKSLWFAKTLSSPLRWFNFLLWCEVLTPNPI